MIRIILLTSFLLISCSDRLKSIEGGWVVPGGYGFEGSAFYFSNNHFNILNIKKIIDIFEINGQFYLSDLSKKERTILRYQSYLNFEGYLLLKNLILDIVCFFQKNYYGLSLYHYDKDFDLNNPFDYQKKYKRK